VRDRLNLVDNRLVVPLLISVFFLSGLTGLVYQSIWTHYLKLYLGHAAYAQSLVLATCMGGLAIGSWLAAQFAVRSRSLLMYYALAEAVIGLYALVFHTAFVALLDFTFDSLLTDQSSAAVVQLLKWGGALLLILPPSILLGTTFPLMADGLIRRQPERPGQLLGLLYFSNSLGAVFGVLISGFVLIRLWGLPLTVYSAGLLNLFIATLVLLLLWLSEGSEDPPAAAVDPGQVETGRQSVQLLLLLCAGFTGLASFIYEVTWIRMLNLVLGSATHSFELMLATFILGLALGGWWIRRRIDGITHPLRQLAWIQLLMGLFAASTVVLYNQLFDAMAYLMAGLDSTEQGYVLFKLASMGIAMAVMLPATICAGMTLPLITATLSRYGYGERAVGHIYAINTLGAILGVAIVTLLLIPVLGLRLSLLSGAAIDVVLAVCLLASSASGLSRRWPLAFAMAGMLGLGALMMAAPFDTTRMASSVYRSGGLYTDMMKILFHGDGRSATVAVTGNDKGQVWIATNGKTDASINPLDEEPTGDEHTMVMLATLGMALRPQAREVAVIGFGSGLTTHVLLGDSQLRRVDTIEIEPLMIEGARHFGDRVRRAYEDARSHVYIEDGKTFFSTHQRDYDIIVAEPSNPWVSGVANLFSSEHYERVRRHLKPDGVYVQWLQLYELDTTLAVSVLKALSENFSDYALYTGADYDLVIAAVVEGKLPELDANYVRQPDLREELQRLGLKNEADVAAKLIATKTMLEPFLAASPVPTNSDYFPYLDQHAERHRYLGTDAGELLDLRRVWLLTDPQWRSEVLRQRTPGRSTQIERYFDDAALVRTMFDNNLELGRSGGVEITVEVYEKAISVSRLLYRCNPALVEASWLGDAVWISELTSIYGATGLISPFWRSQIRSECFEKLPGQVQAAFRFFLAASELDDLEILEQGRLIVNYNFGVPGFWNYRILHMLAAYKRLERPGQAAQFIDSLKDTRRLELDSRVLATYLMNAPEKK
jgi:spermidine synthase